MRQVVRIEILAVFGVIVTAGFGISRAEAQTTKRFNGQNGGDSFGWSAALAGDVNCDGFPDILVGAPGVDSPADFAGRCYLFHGPFGGATISFNQANAIFTAQAFGDNLGVAVASAGDHNGDDCDDVLMGARGHDQPGIQAGRVYLFNGPVSGTKPVTQANAIFTAVAFDELGWAMRGGFDLNGDTIDDVVLGAPFAANIGKAHVYFGPHAATQSTAQADVTINGNSQFEDLGTAVTVGDLNHDGHVDLIAGGPHSNIGQSFPGRAYVFFGPISGTFPAGTANVILQGEAVFDHFGISLATGDVNGDGVEDLVVGADQFDSDETGKAYVFYGPLGGGLISAASADAILVSDDFANIDSFNFGKSVASGIDVNGDGFDDVVVGDPSADVNGVGQFNTGVAYVFHGPLNGVIMASQADRMIVGATGDMLGHYMTGAGDFDGNGTGDFILGAPSSTFSTTMPGHVRLVLSRAVGDFDNDGDVDGADWVRWAACLNGPEVTTPPQGANPADFAAADLDGDDDVDLHDFARFAVEFGS